MSKKISAVLCLGLMSCILIGCETKDKNMNGNTVAPAPADTTMSGDMKGKTMTGTGDKAVTEEPATTMPKPK